MLHRAVYVALFLSAAVCLAQGGKVATRASFLEAPATLPIIFVNTVSANHSHRGDTLLAKTTQPVRLTNGTIVPSGVRIIGRVDAASAFVDDGTPYAQQKQGMLSIRFDSLQLDGLAIPLNVTVRAMADPITSWDAREPQSSDLDSLSTVTQIGGDLLTPSQKEVISRDGDVVGYNRGGSVYAHLIARGHCDGSTVEVSVGIYSASACGLYGFTRISAQETGSASRPSILTLVSSRISPKLWKNSTALLEVLPDQQPIASR
jgi:hypothetical protein